jgi:hypothetical protein
VWKVRRFWFDKICDDGDDVEIDRLRVGVNDDVVGISE